jgi:hypothetical protein
VDTRLKNASLAIQKKMKIAEDLFNFAYEVKYFRLKSLHPDWSPEQLHQKTMELIDRGCA